MPFYSPTVKKTYPKTGISKLRKYTKKGANKRSVVPYKFGRTNSSGVRNYALPAKLQTTFNYGIYDSITLSLAGVSSSRTYRLNSIYDPSFAAGGRTVVGWDPMKDIYGRYLVVGAKVTLTFNSTNSDATWVGYRIRNNDQNSANGNSMQDIVEKPMTTYKPMNTTGQQAVTFKFSVKPWWLVGSSYQQYVSEENFSSTMSNSPANQCFFDVFCNNDSATASVTYSLQIEYDTMLYRRIGLTSTLFA